MSLADETPSALAARHAIAALSYQHLGEHGVAAVHQTKALSALQTVINTLSFGDVEIVEPLRKPLRTESGKGSCTKSHHLQGIQ
jgi:hypothetical protein